MAAQERPILTLPTPGPIISKHFGLDPNYEKTTVRTVESAVKKKELPGGYFAQRSAPHFRNRNRRRKFH